MTFLSPGFRTLVYKESLRFWKVATQTVAAPILTAMLYLLIFGHVLEGRVQVYPGVSYTAFLIPGHDERAAKRLRQLLVVADPVQDHRQPGVRVAHAPVALGDFLGLRAGRHGARHRRRRRRVPHHRLVRAHVLRGAAVDPDLRAAGRRHPRHHGPDRRHLGRKIRPAGGLPELPDHAADLFVGRVLLDPFAAAVLARRLARQPLLLHDRRLPPRLLRPVGRRSVDQPGDCRRLPGRVVAGRHPPAAQRLPPASLSPTIYTVYIVYPN